MSIGAALWSAWSAGSRLSVILSPRVTVVPAALACAPQPGAAGVRTRGRQPPASCPGWPRRRRAGWLGYDGSIWPHHDGLRWLHSVANWTVRSGPVKSGSEKEEQIRSGARSRRHSRPADRGGADSSRPSGASASRHSQWLAGSAARPRLERVSWAGHLLRHGQVFGH